MKINYLKIAVPIWTFILVAFVYFSPTQLKIIPMLAVLLMAAGINYSLYRYLKTTSPTQSEKSRMNILGQFEKKSTLARPLRWTGLILFAIHLAVWLELLNFAYSNYVGLTALGMLFAYIVFAALFFKREIQ